MASVADGSSSIVSSEDGSADSLAVGEAWVGGVELVGFAIKWVGVVVGVSGLDLSLDWDFDGGVNNFLIKVVVDLGSWDGDDAGCEADIIDLEVDWLVGDLVVDGGDDGSWDLYWHEIVDGFGDLVSDLLWNLVVDKNDFGSVSLSGDGNFGVCSLGSEFLNG